MEKYKYLLTYRYALIIHDLTVEFVKKNIDYKSRTRDQMEQAARSGKQNIVEGVGQSQTSKKGEIKLLGVAKASFEELQADYEDFLRQHQMKVYEKGSIIIGKFQTIAYSLSNLRNLSDLGDLKVKAKLSNNPEANANFLLTLCHIVTYLLEKQIKAMIEKFEREGGLTEKLYWSRKNQV
ncbi:MAG: four helix bundle suffix domain-containing protein [Patescibacteria group bacterium]